ncbi:MAG TPA: TadE family protein [Methylocella sp.]|nr:TadE family protein [Methylocella sp.]
MAIAPERLGKLPLNAACSGTAAIEFGLAVPVLVILLTGTVELGFLMYESMQVNNAVEAGVLFAAKNGWDPAGIENAVVKASNVYGAGGPSLTAAPAPAKFCGCPTASGIMNSGTCNSPSPCADGSMPGTYVRISAELPHLSILPGASTLIPKLPSKSAASAVVRIN